MKSQRFVIAGWLAAGAWAAAAQTPMQGKGKVIEEIVARVNNEIITLGQLQRARLGLEQEVAQECRGCSEEERKAMLAEREKNLLRDMIDQSLLVQRAKDAGINVEAELTRQLDAIRVRNNLPDLEALCREVEKALDVSCEEWKDQLRGQMLSQQIIRREVGPEVQNEISREEVRQYYEEHKNEFVRPEKVYLSEIFIKTAGLSPEEVAEREKKAKALLDQLRKGTADFEVLARRNSDGSTAQQGGQLGGFERGQLAKELEEIVFKMAPRQITDVIPTQTGLLILRVDQRFEAGLQSLEKVEPEIMDRLFNQKMFPALRKFLNRLRGDNYVAVKAGYTDTSGVAGTIIQEVQPSAEGDKKGKKPKKGKD